MDDHEAQALETLRNLTLQWMLIAAGVFGIVGGFITASEKEFHHSISLMLALSALALSGFFGYVIHGALIDMLTEKKFNPKWVKKWAAAQMLLFIAGSILFIWFVFFNIGSAKAQDRLTEWLGDPYVMAADTVFVKWNAKEIGVKTEEIRGAFTEAVKRRVESPIYDLEREESYENTMLSRFDQQNNRMRTQ